MNTSSQVGMFKSAEEWKKEAEEKRARDSEKIKAVLEYASPKKSSEADPSVLPSQGLGSSEFTPMRGQLPQWGPGEFEEWKHGKMTGYGTAYGRQRQQLYEIARQQNPALSIQHRQDALAGLRRSFQMSDPDDAEKQFQLQSLLKLYR